MAPTLERVPNNTKIDQPSIECNLDASHKQFKKDKAPLTFQQMLDRIEAAFNRCEDKVDVDEIWNILKAYKSNNIEWSKFAYYDEGKYKRNLVAEHQKYNVMILTWGAGTRSSIHDHAGSHCFMKALDGELVESRFAWPPKEDLNGDSHGRQMCRLSDTRMLRDDVHYIHDKVGLHMVENPDQNRTAASLHVYIPPYRKCRAFDERTSKAHECCLNFYSKCGRVIGDD